MIVVRLHSRSFLSCFFPSLVALVTKAGLVHGILAWHTHTHTRLVRVFPPHFLFLQSMQCDSAYECQFWAPLISFSSFLLSRFCWLHLPCWQRLARREHSFSALRRFRSASVYVFLVCTYTGLRLSSKTDSLFRSKTDSGQSRERIWSTNVHPSPGHRVCRQVQKRKIPTKLASLLLASADRTWPGRNGILSKTSDGF